MDRTISLEFLKRKKKKRNINMTETTLLWNYGNNELWRMCKDYTSLEKASFIIRL